MGTFLKYWEGSARQWNWSNGITLSRALLAPCIPLIALYGNWALLVAVVYAGLSDWLDGAVARWRGEVTGMGIVGDPLADKFFTDFFLMYLAAITGSVALSVLATITILYDMDNTWKRREDIRSALLGTLRIATKPVTTLSKWKTAVLFIAMGGGLFPSYVPSVVGLAGLDVLAIVATTFVLASWVYNYRQILGR